MSLIRLLTSGKCLTGLREPTSRYQMTDPRSMPKFGSTRAPAAVAATAELPGCETPTQEISADPAAEENAPCTSAAPSISMANSLQGSADAGIFSWVAQVRGWVKERFPLPSRQPAVTLVARLPKAAVQGELSLDLVKVVRNDLSDSDLEIVPAKAPANSEVGGAGKAEVGRGPTGRPAARMFLAAKL
jgi:hypothetical protein